MFEYSFLFLINMKLFITDLPGNLDFELVIAIHHMLWKLNSVPRFAVIICYELLGILR